MENLNAAFINDGMAQSDRIVKLNRIAIQQMKILEDTGERKQLKWNDGTKEIHTYATVTDTLRQTVGYATLDALCHLVDTKLWATKIPD